MRKVRPLRVAASCPDYASLLHLMMHSDLLGVLPHPALLASATQGPARAAASARGSAALRDAPVHANAAAPGFGARDRRVATGGGALERQGAALTRRLDTVHAEGQSSTPTRSPTCHARSSAPTKHRRHRRPTARPSGPQALCSSRAPGLSTPPRARSWAPRSGRRRTSACRTPRHPGSSRLVLVQGAQRHRDPARRVRSCWPERRAAALVCHPPALAAGPDC